MNIFYLLKNELNKTVGFQTVFFTMILFFEHRQRLGGPRNGYVVVLSGLLF